MSDSKADFLLDNGRIIDGLGNEAFGQLPSANQSIRLDSYEFTVIDADERRLNSLAVKPVLVADTLG